MAGPNRGYDKAFVPTEAVELYRGVTQTDVQECALPTNGTTLPLGVTQEAATADNVAEGRVINVRMDGTTFLEAAAAITLGANVAFDAAGKGVAAVTGDYVAGIARSAATADGDLIVLQITHSGLTVPA